MKNQHTHITGSFQSAAKLITLVMAIVPLLTGSMIGQAQTAKAESTAFAGRWKITYQNGATREYNIAADGAVTWEGDNGAKSVGRLAPTGRNVFLLEFNDDKIERLTALPNGGLRVEHFNPKSTLARGVPPLMGDGTRVSQPTAVTPAVPSLTLPASGVAGAKSIKLRPGWDSPMQGGSKTHQDLAMVLNGFGKADPNPVFADIEIFNGVKYLMPLNEAVTVLGLDKRLPAIKKVVCPGLPKDSLNYISFDGLFEGHYNRLDLVTDTASQVVSIQLVDETPKDSSYLSSRVEGDWLTYNFIGYRVKAMSQMKVEYVLEAFSPRDKRWIRDQPHYLVRYLSTAPLLRINTVLTNKDRKRLEQTQWYVPKPLADLIMHCISKSQR